MSDATQEKLPIRGDGLYSAGVNDLPNSAAIIAHERNASPSGTTQTKRVSAVNGASNVIALDIALHDGAGNDFTPTNPLPTYEVSAPGDSVCIEQTDFLTKGNPGATGVQTYTAVANFQLESVVLSASDKAKLEVATLQGGTGTAVVKAVIYVSSNVNNFQVNFTPAVQLVASDVLRLRKINRSASDDQDIHSVIMGTTF